MSFDVLKTSTINCLALLRTEINDDVAIVTVCESIRLDLPDTMNITFEGAGPLSGAEDTALDSLLGSFSCPVLLPVGPAMVLVGSTEATSAVASVTIAVPAGTIDGDNMVLIVTQTDGEDGSIDSLAGWVEEVVDAPSGGAAPSTPETSVFTRKALSEPADYTPTCDVVVAVGMVAKMVVFRNGDPTTILDVAPVLATHTGTALPNPPAATPITEGCVALAIWWHDDDLGVYGSVPTGYTDPDGLNSITTAGGGDGASMGCAYRVLTGPAVTEDPGTFNVTGTDEGGSITILLRPEFMSEEEEGAQNLWETIVSDSGSAVADTTTDILSLLGGSGVSTSISGDVLTITNDLPNVDQNLFLNVASDSGTAVADNTTDTLSILGGTGISTSVSGDVLTITNDSPNIVQNLWETIVSDSGSAVANTATDSLSIVGGDGISTAISGDTLTITATGGNARYFDVYDNTGGQVIGDVTPVVINLDAIRTDSGGGDFTLAADEVTINVTGTYRIDFRVTLDQTSETRMTARSWLELNDVEVDGSIALGYLRSTQGGSSASASLVLDLVATDILRLVSIITDTALATATTVADASGLTITAAGSNGQDGADGAETLIIKDEGTNVANTPHSELNFVGDGVVVSDAGGGVATVALIFGDEFNSAESLGTSTTTSSTLQQKLRLSVNVPNGTYIVFWSATGGNSGEERGFRFQVQLDDTTDLTDGTARIAEGDASTWAEPKGGHAVLALNGAHDIDMDFAASGGTATIRDARLTLWRVS